MPPEIPGRGGRSYVFDDGWWEVQGQQRRPVDPYRVLVDSPDRQAALETFRTTAEQIADDLRADLAATGTAVELVDRIRDALPRVEQIRQARAWLEELPPELEG